MARIRSVHPGLFTDERFAFLSDASQVFFIGLWTECDDYGAFVWSPNTLRLKLRPGKDGLVEPFFAELEAADLVRSYEFDGRKYGVVRNFCRFQRPKKPKATHIIPDQFRTYIGLTVVSSEPVPHQSVTGGEIASQMEDGGWRMEKEASAREPERQPTTNRHRIIALDLLDRGKTNLSNWERSFLENLCAKNTITPKMQATLDSIAGKIGFNLETIMATWKHRLDVARKLRQWDAKWGPKPGDLGCAVPDELLQPGDGIGWTAWNPNQSPNSEAA